MSTAGRCGSGSLPYELVDKIISEIAYRPQQRGLSSEAEKTLKNCSLVNHAFRICSQSHLFWYLDLCPESSVRASEVLTGSEHIRGMVRCLVIVNLGDELPEVEACQILLQCTQIHKLNLIGESKPYSDWPTARKEFYSNLLQLPKLTDVSIDWIHFPIQLLQHCRGMKTLEFNGCIGDGASEVFGPVSKAKIELQNLTLNVNAMRLGSVVAWLVNPATCFIDFDGLQTLQLPNRSVVDNETGRSLVQSLQSKNLRFLSVRNLLSAYGLDLRENFDRLERLELEVDLCQYRSLPFVKWLRSSTPPSTSLVISCFANEHHHCVKETLESQQHCYSGFFPPFLWEDLDEALRTAQLMNIEKLQIRARRPFGFQHDHNKCILKHLPYLSSQKYLAFIDSR